MVPGETRPWRRRPFGPVPDMRRDGEELIAWYMQQGLSWFQARNEIYPGDWDEPLDPDLCKSRLAVDAEWWHGRRMGSN